MRNVGSQTNHTMFHWKLYKMCEHKYASAVCSLLKWPNNVFYSVWGRIGTKWYETPYTAMWKMFSSSISWGKTSSLRVLNSHHLLTTDLSSKTFLKFSFKQSAAWDYSARTHCLCSWRWKKGWALHQHCRIWNSWVRFFCSLGLFQNKDLHSDYNSYKKPGTTVSWRKQLFHALFKQVHYILCKIQHLQICITFLGYLWAFYLKRNIHQESLYVEM